MKQAEGTTKSQSIFDNTLEIMTGPSDRFMSMIEVGLPQFTAEALAVKYPDLFSDRVVEVAKERLAAYSNK
jgi:hypothetical protein